MSAKLKISVACGDYDFVRPLKDGTIQADGIDLVFLTQMGSRERHWRMARKFEFDMCEMNFPTYLMMLEKRTPVTAIPVYLHRRFRHGFIFTNVKAGIKSPKDLAGKKVAAGTFQAASNVWLRGIFRDQYGLNHEDVTWVTQRPEEFEFEAPPSLKMELAPLEKSLDSMLVEGEIPALMSPNVPKSVQSGDKRVARLFPNFRQAEVKYFEETGFFPIMHVQVIKREIVDRHPWVATSLFKAFEQAKQAAYKRISNPRMVPLAWVMSEYDDQNRILGTDPWSYGIKNNQKNLEMVTKYTLQQGMIKREMRVKDMFYDTDYALAGGPDEGI